MKTKRSINPVALLGGQIAGGPFIINKRRRWPVHILVALTVLFVLAASGCGDHDGNSVDRSDDPPNGCNGEAEACHRCCTEGPPPGYVKVDYTSNTNCEGPSCTYQRYDNKAIDSTMDICNDQTPPAGWVPATDTLHPDGTFWSPTKCGAPGSDTKNMLKIKKTS